MLPHLPLNKMRDIYLDNSATTPLSPMAREAMLQAMDSFGNPSSLHAHGALAARLLKESRATLGAALGERFLKDGQLVFTSCGTEATALALFGTAHAKARRTAKTILTTDSEHPSVDRALAALAEEGFSVVRVSTKGGVLDMDEVRAHCTPDLFMVSMMLVNNETGAVYPVRDVFSLARAANPQVVCHTDAVQGFLKLPFTPRALGADLVTVSAHKIGGPKGVGALFISERMKRERRIVPFLPGGGQEFGLRSGTENMIGIAGFAAAAKGGMAIAREAQLRMRALSDRLIAGLSHTEITVNRPAVAAPHIVSSTLPDIKSETMLHYLAGQGISVSAGSACSAHKAGPSGVLLAFGLPAARADCTLRISLSPDNTEADIDALLATLAAGVATLVRIRH